MKLADRERGRGLRGADVDGVDLDFLAGAVDVDVAVQIANDGAGVLVAEGVDEGTARGAYAVEVFA